MTVPSRYVEIVGQHVAASAAIGVPGAFAFGADVPLLIGNWTAGAVRIFEETGFSVEEHEVKSLVGGVISAVAAYIAGASLASKVFHLVPGPGTALAVVANTGLNAFFTYRFLRQVANLCNQHDDEEFIWQMLSNTAALITLTGILDDIDDMIRCARAAGEDIL